MLPPLTQDSITIPLPQPMSVVIVDTLVNAISYFAPKIILISGIYYFLKICYGAYQGIPEQVQLLKSIGTFTKNAILTLSATAICLKIMDVAASYFFSVPQLGFPMSLVRNIFCLSTQN